MGVEKGIQYLKRDRFLFWSGLLLIFVGGPGLSLGSFLHDAFRIPLIGQAYDTFGSINQTLFAVGLALLVLGIILLVLSARGGVLSPGDLEAADVGGTLG